MTRKAFIVLILGVIFSLTAVATMRKTEIDNKTYVKYCETRTVLAMQVYDSIKKGLPIDNIEAVWAKQSESLEHTIARNLWWRDLKLEVRKLIMEGKLSIRVKEIVMQRCVADTGVMVYHKEYKGVVPNEINS